MYAYIFNASIPIPYEILMNLFLRIRRIRSWYFILIYNILLFESLLIILLILIYMWDIDRIT